jgi:ABC-type cobalamin transport system permease subunit
MRQLLKHIIIAALLSAAIGAVAGFFLAEGLPEGAIAGAIIGASLGVMVAVRKGAGDSTPSFEYEVAGIHDDNLITTVRRNLVREAYRNSVSPRILEEKIEGLESAERPKRK